MATSHLHSARRNRKPYRSRLGILAFLCATASLLAQSPSQPPVQSPAPAPVQSPAPSVPVAPVPAPPRFVVVLDAAHGGDDLGGKLIDSQDEKAVDLAFSVRLRSLLAARGMQVITTREQDRTLSPIERAETANRANAQACISLHAAESGYGVHIFTSSLTPAQSAAHFTAWKTAQSLAVSRSLALAGVLNSAFSQADINVTLSRTTLPGIDSMTCPAVVLELAPERDTGHKIVSEPGNADYQSRIAQIIAAALLQWKTSDGKTEAAQP
ncbi:N-acetylmuramoyl-L-alanine amidase family protein [Terracidiphilus gabretensis]|uniref:N-acetylmuramoyl-L-alanine amidase family protein n=1 Tax=Terracidiphilus gabretensis TaxID=1577687 RepID=UPI0012F8A43B|nr:N-acetylmuramoyl-L-alanine amidase [Terracidiphilus gabretensis]